MEIMKQCCDKLHLRARRAGAVRGRRQQGGAAERGEMKSAPWRRYPPLQALPRGLRRAGRRGLCGGESAEGRVSAFFVSDGSNRPYRCKIRAPGFPHLQAIDFLTRKHMLADIFRHPRWIDIVFGEIDGSGTSKKLMCIWRRS